MSSARDPFLDLPLRGVQLIEASAGTGKTYTLATLVTRLVVECGLRNAADKWRGSERNWAEGEAPAWRLALRGRAPFADAATTREFARLAGEVFGLLTDGNAVQIDLGEVLVPDADDAEDAA